MAVRLNCRLMVEWGAVAQLWLLRLFPSPSGLRLRYKGFRGGREGDKVCVHVCHLGHLPRLCRCTAWVSWQETGDFFLDGSITALFQGRRLLVSVHLPLTLDSEESLQHLEGYGTIASAVNSSCFWPAGHLLARHFGLSIRLPALCLFRFPLCMAHLTFSIAPPAQFFVSFPTSLL